MKKSGTRPCGCCLNGVSDGSLSTSSYAHRPTRSRPRYSLRATTSGLKRRRSSPISSSSDREGRRRPRCAAAPSAARRRGPLGVSVVIAPLTPRESGPRPTASVCTSSCAAGERAPTVGLASTSSTAAPSSTPRKRSTARTVAVVVGAKIVIDQHQHLLGREHRLVATKLLDVANVIGVLKRQRPEPVSRQVSPLPPVCLERERAAQIVLALDRGLDELQVNRAQEARRLTQDRDDSRPRLDLGDPARRPYAI